MTLQPPGPPRAGEGEDTSASRGAVTSRVLRYNWLATTHTSEVSDEK